MNIRSLLAASALALAAVAALAPGQERERQRERPRERQRARGADKRVPRFEQQRLLRELDLSADQRARIDEILGTHVQSLRNWQKEHGEENRSLREQLAKAREAKDTAAVKEIAAKRVRLNAEQAVLREKLHLRILEVLKGQQKDMYARAILRGRAQLGPLGRIRLIVAALEVNPLQQEQIEGILARGAEAGEKAEGRKAKDAPLRKITQEVKKVLSPEQSDRFEALMRVRPATGPLAGIQLNKDQERAARTILQDARKRAREAEPEQRKAILAEAWEKVRNEVLTEEQRQELKARQQRAEQRKRDRGDRPRKKPQAEAD